MSGTIHCRVCSEAIRGEYRAGVCSYTCYQADTAHASLLVDTVDVLVGPAAGLLGYYRITWTNREGCTVGSLMASGALRAWRIAQCVAFRAGCGVSGYSRAQDGVCVPSKKVA